MASTGDPPCVICGIRLYPQTFRHGVGPHHWEPDRWKQQVIALSGPTWSRFDKGPRTLILSDKDVTRCFTRTSFGSKEMHLEPSDERVTLQEPVHLTWDQICSVHERYKKRTYLGIHSACEGIANKVMRTPRPGKAGIRSLGDLWMTLERRSQKSNWEHNPKSWTTTISREQCIYERTPRLSAEQWWNSDPLHIPNLTASFLSNLQPYKPTSLSHQLRYFEKLPPNIKQHIMFLVFQQELPFRCTYVMPQHYWKEVFFRIPFSWDLDRDLIDKTSSFDMDWEKLTRQIMCPAETTLERRWGEGEAKPWNYQDCGLTVPPGLTNRRRIWQIVEEMYPDDIEMKHWEE
ncbi:hypothetical protein NCS52_00275400 [Fusarium sp. LHS14.1]|nr:hypothetical protein NCS52_00275400 [Fusarium sp. LHS14.1]